MHGAGSVTNVFENRAKLRLSKVRRRSRHPEIAMNLVALQSNNDDLKRLVVMAAELGVSELNVIHCTCWTEEMARDFLYFAQQHSDDVMMTAQEMSHKLGAP